MSNFLSAVPLHLCTPKSCISSWLPIDGPVMRRRWRLGAGGRSVLLVIRYERWPCSCIAAPLINRGEAQPLHSKREGVGFIQCITKRPAEAGLKILAPRVGLEPTTTRLTAAGSTIELSRNCQVAFGCLLASNEIYYTDGGNRCKPQFQNFLDFARFRF